MSGAPEKLQRLRLPSELETYEESAVSLDNTNVRIEVANEAKPIVEDNALYLENHNKLCLVLGEYDKFIVDSRCSDIDWGAFGNTCTKIGTLVVPQIDSELSIGFQNIDKLWVAGNIGSGLYVQNIYKDIHIDLYLPSSQMVPLQNTNNNDNYIRNIYVPEKLMSVYLADKNWSTYSKCFKVIDNVDMFVENSHIGIVPEEEIKLYEKKMLMPLIYDSRLTKGNAIWSSSNNDIATVDSEGNVTAKSLGTTDIAVNIDGYKASCRVTVKEWPTVHVEQPGTLANLLKNIEYDYLAVTGNINGEDFKELNSRTSYNYKDKYTSEGKRTLCGLNLRDANIVEGGVYNEKYNYVCKANTLSRYILTPGSTSKVIILPNSVTKMESYSILECDNLQVLYLPESLSKYEYSAICLKAQNNNVDIKVSESSCLAIKDGLLYKKDFSYLYLCLKKAPKIFIDMRCKDMDGGAFDTYMYNYETIIAPSLSYLYSSLGQKAKNLWLGNANLVSSNSIANSELKVFLPANKMTELSTTTSNNVLCKKIFVPNELLRTYKADANWSKYAICFESIEDCGIVLDECGIWMPETMDMMANSFENATPQILDTRLMNQTMFMTSSNHNIVSISGNDELMSFSHGEADVTVKVGNVSKSCHINVHEWPTIHVEQQGTLAEIIGENTYKYLRITGNINGDDINQLRYLCDANNLGNEGYFTSINSNPVLEYLDIK